MKKFLYLSFFGIFAASSLLANGESVYRKCMPCHGGDGLKIAPGTKGGTTIAGKDKAYLVEQLKGYANGTANNGGAKEIMYNYMKMWKLSDADIESVAEYVSKLPAKQ